MLETTWFALWGILWAVYFVLDGFDFGAALLMPFLARDEKERNAVHQSIGPFWDGNEVWLITAGGVTFAAFPGTYATLFSALYAPLYLILFGLILRGASIGFREEVESPLAKSLCEVGFVVGSFLPALLLGVAFANLFRGVPIDSQGVFQGTIVTLLNPYGLAGGILFVVFFLTHGALWLALKTEGALHSRAAGAARVLWIPLAVCAVGFLLFSAKATSLYTNYLSYPGLWILPLLAVAGLLMSRFWMAKESWGKAWAASGVFIAGAALFGVAGMYPALLPSSLDPAWSVTIANSASSPLTLKIMLGVTLVFIPLVIAYQTWAFLTFREKVDGTGGGYGER